MESYSCKPCDKFCTGIRPYQEHLASAKHKSKMSQEPVSCPAVNPSKSIPSTSDQLSDPFIKPKGRGFFCNLCNLDLNGPDQARTHVAGSKHLKLKLSHSGPGSSGTHIGSESPKLDLSNIKLSSPEDVFHSYSDFKMSFHGVCIDNVLERVRLFGVDDPIEF